MCLKNEHLRPFTRKLHLQLVPAFQTSSVKSKKHQWRPLAMLKWRHLGNNVVRGGRGLLAASQRYLVVLITWPSSCASNAEIFSYMIFYDLYTQNSRQWNFVINEMLQTSFRVHCLVESWRRTTEITLPIWHSCKSHNLMLNLSKQKFVYSPGLPLFETGTAYLPLLPWSGRIASKLGVWLGDHLALAIRFKRDGDFCKSARVTVHKFDHICSPPLVRRPKVVLLVLP